MAKSIFTRDERKAQFLATGIKLAKKSGVAGVAISKVAAEHKVTAPLIFHIFGTRDKFHAAIKAAAKKQGDTLEAGESRKRGKAEVKAIKRKVAAAPKAAAKPKAVAAKPKVSSKRQGPKAIVAAKPKPAAAIKVPKVTAKPKPAAVSAFPTLPAPASAEG